MSSRERSPRLTFRLRRPKRPLRLLFLSEPGLLRHFDTVVVDLAARGHELILVTPGRDPVAKIPRELLSFPNVSCLSFRPRRHDDLQKLVKVSRGARDFLRYLTPELETAWANRDRAWRSLVTVISGDTRPAESVPGSRIGLLPKELETLVAAFDRLEHLVPADAGVERFLASQQPDAVLVTPLVFLGSFQADVVKACASLDVPCGFPVFSWDNLSNKGMIHVCPDRVFVWNDLQAKEAVELHGVPRERLVVTGAPRFDDFFALEPTRTRDELRQALGFDAARPVILYLGSSPFVSPSEPALVDRWIDAVRSASDPTVREAGIIVRPHPRSRELWSDWSPGRWEGVVLDDRSSIYALQRLYDWIHASDAAVGFNTSAQIEAALLGKPVYTLDAGASAPGQAGSSHYYYLLAENGGFVKRASSLDDHLAQLGRGLEGDVDSEAIRRFTEAFVRPHGLDRPATPILAAAFVELAEEGRMRRKNGSRPQPRRAPVPAATSEPAISASEDGDAETTVRIDFPDHEIRIRTTCDTERKRRARPCQREPWTVAWLRQNVRAGDVLYDIGANVGSSSLIAAALIGADGTVVAFEPGFASYARLCENIALNGFGHTIVPVPLPLSRESRLQAFTYRSLDPAESRHRDDTTSRWEPGVRTKRGRYTQPMLAVRLDDAVDLFGLPRPTLVKIDVDGTELDVIAGGSRYLADPALRSVLVGVDRARWDEALEMLAKLAFHVERRHGQDDARIRYAELSR